MTPIDQQLYELFARKELSFWCKGITTDADDDENYCTFLDWNEWLVIHDTYRTVYKANPKKISDTSKWIKILWHPPQLHDVFRVAEQRWYVPEIISYIQLWFTTKEQKSYFIDYNLTLQLLSQSDDTKSAIISLFK
jgi:hypothetical protein